MWNTFETLPECNELVLVAYLDEGAEDGCFDDKKGQWFHVETGIFGPNGFGVAFYLNGHDKVSERQHAQMRETGRWAYAHELAKSMAPKMMTMDFVLVNQSARGIIWPENTTEQPV